MFDFYEKRKIRSFVYSKFSIGILIIFSILLSGSVYERFVVEREMKEKMLVKEEELELLKERAEVLKEKVDNLKNERGIEEELRSRFDVAKEGEQIVIIIDDNEESDIKTKDFSSPPGNDTTYEKKSFLEMFKFW